MNKIRVIFLFLFVALLALSSVQFYMLEVSDLDCISMVEEQQETLGQSLEILGEEFKSPKFKLYAAVSEETHAYKASVVYLNTFYPSISLSVPYTPPELNL